MPLARSCIVCGARTPDGATRCARHTDRGHLLPRSCARCGQSGLSAGNYCPDCDAQLERERSAERERSGARAHYKGGFARRAEAVRRAAYANDGPCWFCGEGTRHGDPWQAHHVDPGNPRSRLAPAHRSCNIADENRRRHARR